MSQGHEDAEKPASALAAGVPQHSRTMQGLERVIVIDGCPNACVKAHPKRVAMRRYA